MELGNARFVHIQAVSNLLHGQLLLIVEGDDLALTLAQMRKRAAQDFALLAAVAQIERIRAVIGQERRLNRGPLRGRTRRDGARAEVKSHTLDFRQSAVPLEQVNT